MFLDLLCLIRVSPRLPWNSLLY